MADMLAFTMLNSDVKRARGVYFRSRFEESWGDDEGGR
jgi:hypothetical protein